jgi:hypothetical protein
MSKLGCFAHVLVLGIPRLKHSPESPFIQVPLHDKSVGNFLNIIGDVSLHKSTCASDPYTQVPANKSKPETRNLHSSSKRGGHGSPHHQHFRSSATLSATLTYSFFYLFHSFPCTCPCHSFPHTFPYPCHLYGSRPCTLCRLSHPGGRLCRTDRSLLSCNPRLDPCHSRHYASAHYLASIYHSTCF